MSEPILYVDTSEIREGKLEELKTAMNELVEFVETNEPGLIAYNVYLNEDGSQWLAHCFPSSRRSSSC
jgi:hypothetical protein